MDFDEEAWVNLCCRIPVEDLCLVRMREATIEMIEIIFGAGDVYWYGLKRRVRIGIAQGFLTVELIRHLDDCILYREIWIRTPFSLHDIIELNALWLRILRVVAAVRLGMGGNCPRGFVYTLRTIGISNSELKLNSNVSGGSIAETSQTRHTLAPLNQSTDPRNFQESSPTREAVYTKAPAANEYSPSPNTNTTTSELSAPGLSAAHSPATADSIFKRTIAPPFEEDKSLDEKLRRTKLTQREESTRSFIVPSHLPVSPTRSTSSNRISSAEVSIRREKSGTPDMGTELPCDRKGSHEGGREKKKGKEKWFNRNHGL